MIGSSSFPCCVWPPSAPCCGLGCVACASCFCGVSCLWVQAERAVLHLDIQIAAPTILIPTSVLDASSPMLVLDMGTAAIQSRVLQAPPAAPGPGEGFQGLVENLAKAGAQPNGPGPAPQGEGAEGQALPDPYENYVCTLRGIRVELCKGSAEYKAGRATSLILHEGELHEHALRACGGYGMRGAAGWCTGSIGEAHPRGRPEKASPSPGFA